MLNICCSQDKRFHFILCLHNDYLPVDGVYAVKYVTRCVSWIQECHVHETSVYTLN